MSKLKTQNTKEQSKALVADINAGVLTKRELIAKYKYSSLNSLNSTMYWFKKKGLIGTTQKPEVVVVSEAPVAPVAKRQYKKRIAAEIVKTPKGVVSSIRTISFPDGFKIQIEKSFISGVLIHESGNITIIK